MITAARKRPLCVICLILMFLILLAKTLGLPFFGAPPENSILSMCVNTGRTVRIIGTVADRKEKARSVQYVLANSYLQSENDSIPLNTISMISTKEKTLSAGSVICVSGTLSVPEMASNPGQFDLKSYYASQRIYYSLYAESCRVLQQGNGLKEQLLQIRNRFSVCLDQMMETDSAEVMKAMVLGERTGLTADTKRDYQVGGILHILAISGMHISLLGQGLLKLLEKSAIPFPLAAACSLVLLILYCLLTGAAPSAVRAVCMFAVLIGARLLLRTYDSLSALALAGILMLLENPSVLFASGFQLSFCAILAVSLGWPATSWLLPGQIRKPGKLLRKAGAGKGETRELVRKSIAGWFRYFYRLFFRYSFFWLTINVMMLPLTAWYYYEIPVWGMLPNLLLVPAAPVLLTSGVMGLLLGLISIRVGKLALLPAGWILRFFAFISSVIRKLPFSTIVSGKPVLWQVLAATIILILLIVFLLAGKKKTERIEEKKKKDAGRMYRKVAAAGLGLSLFVLLFRWEPLWSLTMLDVGQGDCLVLRDRVSCFLVDGGSSSVKEVGNYRILPYLKSQGITRLNGVFVTHPDEDHTNGLLEVFSQINERKVTLEIDILYLPIWMEDSEDETELITAAMEAKTEVVYLSRGDTVSTKLLEIQVLNPFAQGGIRSGNSGSLVLSVNCGSFDALLTGDLESDGEKQLLPLDKKYEYLKAAHHGSKGASSEIFLQQIRPVVVAVSAPRNSSYGHPHQETMDRFAGIGAAAFVTRDCGAIRVEGSMKKWWLRGYLGTYNCSDSC